MENIIVQKPIGLNNLLAEVDNLISKGNAYRFCGDIKIPDFIIEMESGNGRSIFTEYLVDVCRDNHLYRFDNCDYYYEYVLNGKPSQLEDVFMELYMQQGQRFFVTLDITKLLIKDSDSLIDSLINHIKEFPQVVFILFVSPVLDNRFKKRIKKIKGMLYRTVCLSAQPYTVEEKALIVERHIEKYSVNISDYNLLHMELVNCFNRFDTISICRAIEIGDELVINSDFSNPRKPKLSISQVQKVLRLYQEGET